MKYYYVAVPGIILNAIVLQLVARFVTESSLWDIYSLICCYPVAVPGIFLADGAASSSADRCHSLPSLAPPLAAVGSLPKFELAHLLKQTIVSKKESSSKWMSFLFWSC